MKQAIASLVLIVQLLGAFLLVVMNWANSAHRANDPYAQMAAMIVGVPTSLLSALGLWALYSMRNSLPERYRDAVLLGSTAMAIVTGLATTTGLLGL